MRIRIFTLLLAAIVPVVAQVPSIPAGGVVVEIQAAPLPADWQTSDTLPKGAKPESGPVPIRFVGTSGTPSGMYQRIDYADGKSEETWWIERRWIGFRDRAGKMSMLDLQDMPLGETFNREWIGPWRAPGLDWLAGATFRPMGDPPKVLYAVLEPKPEPQETEEGVVVERPVTFRALRAWVNPENKQLLAVQRDRQLLIYRFGESVTVPPLPAELQQALAEQQRTNAFIEAMRKRNAPQR